MSFHFRPAKSFTDRHGVFVSLTGSTNSGKTYSALRLARGIAGPNGKIAVLDTEGGRTLHLKDQFDFDAMVMDPPFRPHLFAEAAKAAEDAKYDAFLIDSWSMEWTGIGGVIDWHEEELSGMVERAKARGTDRRSEYQIREAGKMAAWIKPKMEHKAAIYSLLQRRIPIIFAIRGEESVKPGDRGEKPQTIFKSVCSPTFPFEVTVSFRLASDRKGYLDLSDPGSWKMEEAHQAIFRDGDRISEEHGAALARWACGAATISPAGSSGPLPPATFVNRAEAAIAKADTGPKLMALMIKIMASVETMADFAAIRALPLVAKWEKDAPAEAHILITEIWRTTVDRLSPQSEPLLIYAFGPAGEKMDEHPMTPMEFARWFAETSAKLPDATAFREFNADAIADAGSDPEAAKIIQAALSPADEDDGWPGPKVGEHA